MAKPLFKVLSGIISYSFSIMCLEILGVSHEEQQEALPRPLAKSLDIFQEEQKFPPRIPERTALETREHTLS